MKMTSILHQTSPGSSIYVEDVAAAPMCIQNSGTALGILNNVTPKLPRLQQQCATRKYQEMSPCKCKTTFSCGLLFFAESQKLFC